MSFYLQLQLDCYSVIVLCHGELDMASAPLLSEAISTCPSNHVVLDMAGVSFMDAFGVGLLVEERRKLEARQGSLYVQNVSEPVYKVLDLTQLTELITPVAEW